MMEVGSIQLNPLLLIKVGRESIANLRAYDILIKTDSTGVRLVDKEIDLRNRPNDCRR